MAKMTFKKFCSNALMVFGVISAGTGAIGSFMKTFFPKKMAEEPAQVIDTTAGLTPLAKKLVDPASYAPQIEPFSILMYIQHNWQWMFLSLGILIILFFIFSKKK